MVLKHKSKLRVYGELKREMHGFEEYIDYSVCKGSTFQIISKFHSWTYGLFEELCRHDNGHGSQECPNCRACKESIEHFLFECVLYDSQRLDFWIT